MLRQEQRHILGPVLAVAVHHHHRVDVVARRGLGEPDRDRALMAEIEREAHDGDGADRTAGRQGQLPDPKRRVGTVVDRDDVEARPGRDQIRLQRRNQSLKRLPIVQYRSDDGDARLNH